MGWHDLVPRAETASSRPHMSTGSNCDTTSILLPYSGGVPITEITRLALADEFTVRGINWSGRFEEPDFLSRLYDMENMPSTDKRFPTAYRDVWQHRVNNDDWENDWIFYDDRFSLLRCDDETFLRFLAETVHPALRRERREVDELVAIYNDHLRHDGYEITEVTQISGRPVFAGRSRLSVPGVLRQVERAAGPGDHDYLTQQITRMEGSIESDPELAIGTAKELIETSCITVLIALGVEVNKKWDLPRLVKETAKELQLTPDGVKADAAAADTIRRVLGNLASIVAGIAELRNAYGTGHGKAVGRGGLGPRHARLAVGAAATLAVFIFETYERRSA